MGWRKLTVVPLVEQMVVSPSNKKVFWGFALGVTFSLIAFSLFYTSFATSASGTFSRFFSLRPIAPLSTSTSNIAITEEFDLTIQTNLSLTSPPPTAPMKEGGVNIINNASAFPSPSAISEELESQRKNLSLSSSPHNALDEAARVQPVDNNANEEKKGGVEESGSGANLSNTSTEKKRKKKKKKRKSNSSVVDADSSFSYSREEAIAATGGGGGGDGKEKVPLLHSNRSVTMPIISEKIDQPDDQHSIRDGGTQRKCDIFDGRWVKDENFAPFYPGGSCPYIDDDFNCHKNGRPDTDFLKWRWRPHHCEIPRMNATDFLERLRGQRLIFVGDSLNRNMWESLVCTLRHVVKNKKKVYEHSGRRNFKTSGYYSFRFEEYKCSVDFVRSSFLVKEAYFRRQNGSVDEKLRLDLLDETTVAYRTADIIVFNTGHWWTHEKTSEGIDYYQEGNYVYPLLKVKEAYEKALTTWAKWVDTNINPRKTQVFFRGYSLTHFSGGQWNSGGQCHKEMEPIFNETFLQQYPWKMRTLEKILQAMKTPVVYLNISKLTNYRKDGHPSIYRKMYKTLAEWTAAEKSQDCSHWCLPGIPDAWNELLYASLLMIGKGPWKR